MMISIKNWRRKAFNTSVLEQKRHVWVDYLRGIIIILVVYHHAFLGMERSNVSMPKVVADANLAVYSFRMPLFFVLSGLFTGLSLQKKSVSAIVKNKFNVLLYPYLIWTVIYLLLQMTFANYVNSKVSYHHFLYILYQPKQLSHFWYLPALFNSSIVFIFLKAKVGIGRTLHLFIGVLLFVLAPFINEISMISNWMRFYIFLVVGDILSSFILNKELQHKLQQPRYFLGFIPLFIAAQVYYFKVLGIRSLETEAAGFPLDLAQFSISEVSFLAISLVGCATFIVLAFLMEKWSRAKWLRVVGFHSLYIYIVHVMAIAMVRGLLLKLFGENNYLPVLLIAIAVGVVVPIVFYNLLGKRYLWFLFSPKRPPVEPAKNNLNNQGDDVTNVQVQPIRKKLSNI